MRRFLVILLLALLPLQFAFAAAANYCIDKTKCVSAHFGHHECGNEKSPESDGSGIKVHDCGICHISHAQAHPSIHAQVVVEPATPLTLAAEQSPPGRSLERLERPPRATLA